MNLSCVIVEDLAVAAEFLKKCCERNGQTEVKGHFTNVKDALAFLNEYIVDLIFLDVEMPGEDGFYLLDQLSFTPKVILTTSKTEYAYTAFEHNVTDFLKKPFSYQRFTEAIKKVISSIEISQNEKGEDHIFIKSDGKLIRLLNDDILYIESMGDYVKFVTADKKYVAHHTIKSMEEKTNRQVFMKVHRSYIINITKVENIRENALYIKGMEIPISKAHRPSVMNRINIL